MHDLRSTPDSARRHAHADRIRNGRVMPSICLAHDEVAALSFCGWASTAAMIGVETRASVGDGLWLECLPICFCIRATGRRDARRGPKVVKLVSHLVELLLHVLHISLQTLHPLFHRWTQLRRLRIRRSTATAHKSPRVGGCLQSRHSRGPARGALRSSRAAPCLDDRGAVDSAGWTCLCSFACFLVKLRLHAQETVCRPRR